MNKLWEKIKPKLVWVLAGAGAVLSVVIAVVTFGRSKKQRVFGNAPPRPELDDPKAPDIPVVDLSFDDKPADTYKKNKTPTSKKMSSVINDLNADFD